MFAIESSHLNKNFKSYQKSPGILGSIRSLYKRDYIIKNAVDNFDLQIPKGQIVGLLGPNGAGKTTLMKMFTGIIVPSSGTLRVVGHTPSDREKDFRKKISLVMGQKSQLWWDIPAMDSFQLLQKYYEIPKREFDEKIEQMSSLLKVNELLHIHVRKLSLGERMKLELMASLLHSPEIIFLDEPTIGLDLIAQENIRNFIKDHHKKHNTTIILTSHYMTDVQELCSRLILINGGKKHYDDSIEKFEQLLGTEKTLYFTFKDSQKSSDYLEKYGIEWTDQDQKSLELRVPESEIKAVSTYMLENYDVIHFGTDKIPIEKVMKKVMVSDAIS